MKLKDLSEGMRDVPIPPHECLSRVDADGYCTACGEKTLRGPIQEIHGIRPGDPYVVAGWTSRNRTGFDLTRLARGKR